MSDTDTNKDLIPQDAARSIIEQVNTVMIQALSNQVELSKVQLVMMMNTCLNEAIDNYASMLSKKLNEYMPKIDDL